MRGLAMIVKVESLKKLFEHNDNARHIYYEGTCYNCGCDVKIEIAKTTAGYGLLGGVLYEKDPSVFWVRCDSCYKKLATQILEYDYSI